MASHSVSFDCIEIQLSGVVPVAFAILIAISVLSDVFSFINSDKVFLVTPSFFAASVIVISSGFKKFFQSFVLKRFYHFLKYSVTWCVSSGHKKNAVRNFFFALRIFLNAVSFKANTVRFFVLYATDM